MAHTPSLGLLLHHLSLTLDRQSDSLLHDACGVGFSQFKIMMVLLEQRDVRQRDVAEALGQTEASVSRQIQTLVDEGLVWSVKDLRDRRQRITRLTTKGEKLALKATSVLERHYGPMFSRLSEQDQEKLRSQIEYMCDYMKMA